MPTISVLTSTGDGKERSKNAESDARARSAARVLWVAGYVFLFGTLIDLGILWFGQKQSGLQWEFVAIANTTQAWPRLVLAVGLFYAGAHIGRSESWVFRFLGFVTLMIGLGAAALGGLAVLNTLTMWKTVSAGGGMEVKTTAAKTLALSALYIVLLIPTGVLGLKKPRG